MRPESITLKRATMVFIVAFLAVQIAIPVVALAGPRPARFAWQMYSGARSATTYEIVLRDGNSQAINIRDYVGNPRLDIDYSEVLPAHLCAVEPAAVAIREIRSQNTSPSEVACSR